MTRQKLLVNFSGSGASTLIDEGIDSLVRIGQFIEKFWRFWNDVSFDLNWDQVDKISLKFYWNIKEILVRNSVEISAEVQSQLSWRFSLVQLEFCWVYSKISQNSIEMADRTSIETSVESSGKVWAKNQSKVSQSIIQISDKSRLRVHSKLSPNLFWNSHESWFPCHLFSTFPTPGKTTFFNSSFLT